MGEFFLAELHINKTHLGEFKFAEWVCFQMFTLQKISQGRIIKGWAELMTGMLGILSHKLFVQVGMSSLKSKHQDLISR